MMADHFRVDMTNSELSMKCLNCKTVFKGGNVMTLGSLDFVIDILNAFKKSHKYYDKKKS